MEQNERLEWATMSFTALLNMSHEEIVDNYLNWKSTYIEAVNEAEDSQERQIWLSCLQLMEDEMR